MVVVVVCCCGGGVWWWCVVVVISGLISHWPQRNRVRRNCCPINGEEEN